MALSVTHAKTSAIADSGDSTLVQPSDWNASHVVSGSADLLLATKTAGYTAVSSDTGKMLDFTVASLTLSLTAAATLGAGWYCYVRNSSAGSLTIDPNASELIDGTTTATVASTEIRLVLCDGSAFTSVALTTRPDSLVVLTSGTSWTCPAGVFKVRMRMVGGGGSGANYGSDGVCAGSGGSGGYLEAIFTASPGTSYTYAIGAAAGATSLTANGITYTANGGSNGGSFTGGAGGSASGTGALTITGETGQGQCTATTANGARGKGGSSPLGSYGSGGGGAGASGAVSGTQGVIVLELYK